MRRISFKEYLGWGIFLALLYFGLLGGTLPSFGGSDPTPSAESTNVGTSEPGATPAAAVAEPTNDGTAAVADSPVHSTTDVEPRTTLDVPSGAAASGRAAEASPWTSIPTNILAALVIGTTGLLLGIGVIFWFLWTHRKPVLVTPEGVRVEIEHQPLATLSQRSSSARPAAGPRRPTPLLAPSTPVVEQPISYLPPAAILAAYRALGHTPQPQELLPNRNVRVVELMAALGATHGAIAQDYSVLVIPGLVRPIDQIKRLAAPQPAVMTANHQGPIVVVGLWQPANIITSSDVTIEAVQPAPATPPTTRAERTTQLIPAIPQQVPFPNADQLNMLTQGKLPILLAVQGPQGSQQRWITRALFSGHWGIAGKSQRGKGNFLRYILLNLLTLPPTQLQAIVLDLKGGADFGFVLKLRHARLYTPRDADGQCIGDGDLADGLAVALNEMAHRNRLFIEAGVWNIAQYNAKSAGPALPWMIVIIDEAFDLPNDLKPKLHSLVARSISAGIVLLVSTQHPANVLSTQIRGNYSTYVAFRVEAGRNFVEAALGLAQGGDSLYDPSAIPDTPGIAVIRFDDQEHLGRVPEITDDLQAQLTQRLFEQYPRVVSTTSEQANHAEQPAPACAAMSQPDHTAPTIDLTTMSAAEWIAALTDPASPAGDVARQWLASIGHHTATPSRPEQPDEPAPELRPYNLVDNASPHKISLKECAEHPIVVQAVLRVYHDLKTRVGFNGLSGRVITAHVFERGVGSADGWTSSRWAIVKSILDKHNLLLPTTEPVSVSDTVRATGAESEDRAA